MLKRPIVEGLHWNALFATKMEQRLAVLNFVVPIFTMLAVLLKMDVYFTKIK